VANSHDVAARRIAKKFGCRYRRDRSPDVKCPRIRVEVKSKASEIPKAQRQLAGVRGPSYIALPKREHPEALRRLSSRKTGLMNYQGKITKRSTRK